MSSKFILVPHRVRGPRLRLMPASELETLTLTWPQLLKLFGSSGFDTRARLLIRLKVSMLVGLFKAQGLARLFVTRPKDYGEDLRSAIPAAHPIRAQMESLVLYRVEAAVHSVSTAELPYEGATSEEMPTVG